MPSTPTTPVAPVAPAPATAPDLSRLLAAGPAAKKKAANRKNSNEKPSGKFAAIGGIERRPACVFENSEKPIDFSEIGGKVVRKAPGLPEA
jgi:hypothetical protein